MLLFTGVARKREKKEKAELLLAIGCYQREKTENALQNIVLPSLQATLGESY